MRTETVAFCQKLVTLALRAIEAWDEWIASLQNGSKKVLNMALIRLAKGQVKAWRIYLSESCTPAQQTLSNTTSVMLTAEARKTKYGYAGDRSELHEELSNKKDFGKFNRPSF